MLVPPMARAAGDDPVVVQHFHDVDAATIAESLDVPTAVDPHCGFQELFDGSAGCHLAPVWMVGDHRVWLRQHRGIASHGPKMPLGRPCAFILAR